MLRLLGDTEFWDEMEAYLLTDNLHLCVILRLKITSEIFVYREIFNQDGF